MNRREWIITGDLPAYMLDWKGRTLVTNADDYRLVKLPHDLECVKRESGYWSIDRVVDAIAKPCAKSHNISNKSARSMTDIMSQMNLPASGN
jgi:hypothetical protein